MTLTGIRLKRDRARLIDVALGLLGPIALGGAILLSDFAGRGVPLVALARSAIVLGALTSLTYVLLLLALRRPAMAAVGTTLAVIAIWSGATAIWMGFIAVLVWRLVRLRRRAVAWHWETVSSLARTMSVALFAVVAIGALQGVPSFAPEVVHTEQQPGPPIYVVLLDAYPRADALAEWGYDNEWFLKGLEDRGFDVARLSTSNYDRTQHTLTSMLYMQHLEEIDALQQPPDDVFGRLRLLTRLIATGGPMFEFLREHGYRVMTIPSPVVDVTMWGAEIVDVGHVSDYEIHLVNDTDAGHLLTMLIGTDWLADQSRRGVRSQFDALVASQGPGRFIWTHLMVPHPPYVFGPNGGIAECFPKCRYWTAPDSSPQRLIDQIAEVNALTLAAIDQLSPDAVVVLFSDHASGFPNESHAFGNLIALRTPGRPALIPEDGTVTTIFPNLFNEYFDAGIPVPEGRHYDGGPPGTRLQLTRID